MISSARFAGRPAATDAVVPALLRAGQAALAWSERQPEQGRGDHLSTAALFLAAGAWRHAGGTPALALPFWSATPAGCRRSATSPARPGSRACSQP